MACLFCFIQIKRFNTWLLDWYQTLAGCFTIFWGLLSVHLQKKKYHFITPILDFSRTVERFSARLVFFLLGKISHISIRSFLWRQNFNTIKHVAFEKLLYCEQMNNEMIETSCGGWKKIFFFYIEDLGCIDSLQSFFGTYFY